MSEGITFQAIFAKATTTVDGGWNVTLSLSQDESAKVMQMSAMRDSMLQVAVIPVSLGELDDIRLSGEI